MIKLIIFLAISGFHLAQAQDNNKEHADRVRAFRALEHDISFTCLGKNEKLPDDLEKFEALQMVAGVGTNRVSIAGIRAINSFVIVPGAPEIKKAPGIPETLVGKRLYIISRFPNHDNTPANADKSDPLSGGRRTIILSEHDSKLEIPWIPEPTALLIMAELGNFQPMKQPPAFASQAKAAGFFRSGIDKFFRK